jgi:hypothetical protein
MDVYLILFSSVVVERKNVQIKVPEKWYCIIGRLFPNILKDCHSFLLMVKHSKKIGGPSDLEEEGNVSL